MVRPRSSLIYHYSLPCVNGLIVCSSFAFSGEFKARLFWKTTDHEILLNCFTFCSSDVDVVQEDHVKIVRAGEDVNLTCTFSSLLQTTTAWFKQTADRKNVQIVSFYIKLQPSWNKDFEKANRFIVIKGDDHFNLTILKTKPSDSATYFCVVSSHYTIGMGAGTRLLVKGMSSIDKLHPGDSVSLQCSIFTESCAGEHSVYWFRQSLGESQGILYTKGERNGQCENSTESQTQSCVYNLFKSNISHSDAGIYYCAVAACGEILFGKGTELNFRVHFLSESVDVTPTLLALGFSNIIFFALVVFLGIKLYRNEDTLNYAAISFGQKPLNTRRAKAKISQDQSLYAHVRSHQ
uniref:Uncharacterized LOC107603163 n=1 Tax=Sinocyclocheilus grahami TaxID=75366 RepID=A0A672QXG6_SINGR